MQHIDPTACHRGRCVQYGGLELVQKERCTHRSHNSQCADVYLCLYLIVCMHKSYQVK